MCWWYFLFADCGCWWSVYDMIMLICCRNMSVSLSLRYMHSQIVAQGHSIMNPHRNMKKWNVSTPFLGHFSFQLSPTHMDSTHCLLITINSINLDWWIIHIGVCPPLIHFQGCWAMQLHNCWIWWHHSFTTADYANNVQWCKFSITMFNGYMPCICASFYIRVHPSSNYLHLMFCIS